MKQAGFSLLELSIVIALLGLLIMLGIMVFPSYDRLFVHTELDRLYMAFLACSHKAIATGVAQTISFDPTTNTLTLDGTEQKLTSRVCFGSLAQSWGPPASPAAPIEDPVTFKHHQAICYPDGTIQAGRIYLTDSNKQHMFALTSAVGQVPYVRRYRYNASVSRNQAWELIV